MTWMSGQNMQTVSNLALSLLSGFMLNHRNEYKGRRQSTSHTYLRPVMHRKNLHVLTPVADPGFSPGGGRQLPKVLLFFNFLPKTAWKWKNLDPQGGRASLAPPWIRQCTQAHVSKVIFDGNSFSFTWLNIPECSLLAFMDKLPLK